MSRQKTKGTRFETAAVRWLRSEGFEADRVALHGVADEGDVRLSNGTFDAVVECKDRKRYDWVGALDEAVAEAENAGASLGVALMHRPGCGDKAFGGNVVVMELESFADLMRWSR